MEWIILLYKCHGNKLMDLWHTFMSALETKKFSLNSNWTSLNIYGNCKVSRRNFFFLICWEAWVIGTWVCELLIWVFIVIWYELCMRVIYGLHCSSYNMCSILYGFFDKVSPLHCLYCSKIASWQLWNCFNKKNNCIYIIWG